MLFSTEIVLPKEEAPKKTKIKQPTPVVPRQINRKPSLATTQIVQMEDPADFVPTIVPEQRRVSTPRIIRMENNHVNNSRQVSSPTPRRERSKQIVRAETFEKEAETPAPPTVDNTPTTPVINRLDTFVSKREDTPPPPPSSVEPVPSTTVTRVDTVVNITENTSLPNEIKHGLDTFISKPETPPPPPPRQPSPLPVEMPSEPTPSQTEELVLSNETIPIVDLLPTEQPEIKEVKVDIPLTPRISTPPPKVTVEGKHPIKAIYSFLNEARRWAQQTRDVTYANLILSTEELLQHLPSRKTGGTLRKLADIDVQVLAKAAKSPLPKEVDDKNQEM